MLIYLRYFLRFLWSFLFDVNATDIKRVYIVRTCAEIACIGNVLAFIHVF